MIVDFKVGSVPTMVQNREEYETSSTVGLPALHATRTPSKEQLFGSSHKPDTKFRVNKYVRTNEG